MYTVSDSSPDIVMPNSDPQEKFKFYPSLTLMIDSYNGTCKQQNSRMINLHIYTIILFSVTQK